MHDIRSMRSKYIYMWFRVGTCTDLLWRARPIMTLFGNFSGWSLWGRSSPLWVQNTTELVYTCKSMTIFWIQEWPVMLAKCHAKCHCHIPQSNSTSMGLRLTEGGPLSDSCYPAAYEESDSDVINAMLRLTIQVSSRHMAITRARWSSVQMAMNSTNGNDNYWMT